MWPAQKLYGVQDTNAEFNMRYNGVYVNDLDCSAVSGWFYKIRDQQLYPGYSTWLMTSAFQWSSSDRGITCDSGYPIPIQINVEISKQHARVEKWYNSEKRGWLMTSAYYRLAYQMQINQRIFQQALLPVDSLEVEHATPAAHVLSPVSRECRWL